MLTGPVQKTTTRSYFSGDAFIQTCFFNQMTTQDTFKLTSKFLHFINNGIKNPYSGPPKIYKIHSMIEMLCGHFWSTSTHPPI